MKKRLIIVGSLFITLMILIFNVSWASFAEYDDETAREETENLLKEQEKNNEKIEIKSNNNYLANISVEKYNITPEFDKQIQEYKIDEKVKESTIEIKAETEDKRASINGTGSIELKKGENKIRIDVTSERGAVRTYFINVEANNEKNDISKNENKEIDNEKIKENENIELISQKQFTGNKNIVIIVITMIFIILIAIIYFLKKIHKKSKH